MTAKAPKALLKWCVGASSAIIGIAKFCAGRFFQRKPRLNNGQSLS
jgi:hypothetical protein